MRREPPPNLLAARPPYGVPELGAMLRTEFDKNLLTDSLSVSEVPIAEYLEVALLDAGDLVGIFISYIQRWHAIR